jgi:hypothetical protein
MSFLAPKLVLTPLLIASASLVGRRWGAATTGWLVALPLTSGPILVFIALELGHSPAAAAAAGSLTGSIGQIAFVLGYAAIARRASWPFALASGSVAFAAIVSIIPTDSQLDLFLLCLGSVAIAVPLLVWTRQQRAHTVRSPGRWDIPIRAVVASILVVTISGAAPMIGGHAAGVLATFPVYGAVLTTFAHRNAGSAEAHDVLLGLASGMPGFASFFLIASSLLGTFGIWLAVSAGLTVAIALNLAVLGALRRVTLSDAD